MDGSVRADPPWLPVVDLVHRLPAVLRGRLSWFLEDGAYGMLVEPEDDSGSTEVICARVYDGRVVSVVGAETLELDDPDPEPEQVLRAMKHAQAQPRVLARGTRSALSRTFSDPHPSTRLTDQARPDLAILRELAGTVPVKQNLIQQHQVQVTIRIKVPECDCTRR